MDKDLVTYLQQMEKRLDERFAETGRQIQALREETQQGLTEVRGGIRQVQERTAQGFKEVKDDIRGAHVLIEGLREDVRQVSDGVINVNERLDRYREEVSRQFKEVETRQRLAYQDLKGRLETQ